MYVCLQHWSVSDGVNFCNVVAFERHSQGPSLFYVCCFQVMRRYGVPEPYEKLKELTRGRAVTKESIREFTEGLELPEEAKAALLRSTPQSYIGAAESLAKAIDTSIYSLKKTLEMNGYNYSNEI